MGKGQINSKDSLLNAYIKEWEVLLQYINDIDKGYAQNITIFASVVAVAVTLLNVIDESDRADLSLLFYLVPVGFLVCFGFLGYQFRITAILRGHLGRVEKEINDLLGENVFMWNSSLVDTYMARRNIPNSCLMIPILFFVIVLVIYCVNETMKINTGISIIYWPIVFVLSVIIFVPFLTNGTVRYNTYNTEDVLKKYIEAAVCKNNKIESCIVKFSKNNITGENVIKAHCVIKPKYINEDKTHITQNIKFLVHRILPAGCSENIEVEYVEDLSKELDKMENFIIKVNRLLSKEIF